MRILFVSQFIYRPDQPAANRIYDFLQHLAARGHKPHVVAGAGHYLHDSPDPELARKKIIDTAWGDVPVTLTYARPNFRKGVISRLRSYFNFAWYAARALVRVGRVDAILVSIQPIFVAPIAWVISRMRGVPLILEVRDLWPDAAVEVGLIKSPLLIGLGRWLEGFVYRKAQHIIVIGYEMKRLIVSKGIDPDKIDVFPQGFQPGSGPPQDRGASRKNLDLAPDDFVLMFTGSFGLANNDVPSIVEAAIRLKDEPGITIVFVGEGDQKQPSIDRCALAGAENVRFLPLVAKQDVHHLLAAADAGVMTLPPGDFWKICLQNKFFDYLGNGLPLIAAVAGDQERLLRAADGGIVVRPGDVDGLVEAILRLKRDPALRRRLGDNAREYVRAHLMRADIVSDYADLLERLVGAP